MQIQFTKRAFSSKNNSTCIRKKTAQLNYLNYKRRAASELALELF